MTPRLSLVAKVRCRNVLHVLACVASLAGPAFAAPRWEEMDYGPFLASSVSMHPPRDVESPIGVTVKGITVKLNVPGRRAEPGAAPQASVCFDTNLLCYTAGWEGGWLKLMGTPFGGDHRPPEKSRPAVDGKMLFEMPRNVPGWARGGSFADPRDEPYVPLPKEWAHYKGLYVNGDRVVFSYTVGDCDVLDAPAVEENGGQLWITRTLHVGPSKQPLQLLMPGEPAKGELKPADAYLWESGACFVDGGIAGCGWKTKDGRTYFEILPRELGTSVKLSYGAHSADRVLKRTGDRLFIEDVPRRTKGGAARFATTVDTAGKLGAGDGSHVVDTLTLPDDNPYKSWMRVGGFDFFKDGKSAALCTWSGDVWTVAGIDGKLEKLTWRRIAAGLFQPLGLKIVDEKIYVLGRDQVTRLVDLNGDGETDFYENFNNDIGVTPNFHEFVLDLETDPAGDFYFTKGAPLLGTELLDLISKHNGCLLKLSKDGKTLTPYATGLRAPNGAGVGPNGEVTCSDNQGIWTPACRVNLVTEPGKFLGLPGTSHRKPEPMDYDRPLLWLPMSADNSSGDQVWVSGDKWGLPAGSLLHLSYGKCALFHLLRDEVDGQQQAAAVRFPLKFDTGVMRSRFNPADGQLYVAGLKGWQTDGARDGALQRVRYTGKPLRTIAGWKVKKDAIDLSFTTPLSPESAKDAGAYAVEQWNYRWTKAYGSPDFKLSDPSKQGRDTVEVRTAKLSPDGKTVTLEIPGLKPSMQFSIKAKLDAADGKAIDAAIVGTIHAVPK